MSLQQVLDNLKQAQEQLAQVIEYEERKEGTERPIMYCFVYQQHFDDDPEPGPSHQLVQAHSLIEAFSSFANCIEVMHLRVFNICYGTYSEMEAELKRVDQYWRERHAKRG